MRRKFDFFPKQSFLWMTGFPCPLILLMQTLPCQRIIAPKRNYSILLVENEVDVDLFKGHFVRKKYNIERWLTMDLKGLEKIKGNEPDLVISDVIVPEMGRLRNVRGKFKIRSRF